MKRGAKSTSWTAKFTTKVTSHKLTEFSKS